MVHENLKKIRIAKGVTKTFLAKKIDVTMMTYTRIEEGESKLDVERLKIIASVLGIEISIFFDDKLTESVINNADDLIFKQKQLA